MSVDDILKLMVITSFAVLPALAVTARFALKPVVEALLLLRGAGSASNADEVRRLTSVVESLREEVASLQGSVAQLQEAQHFDQTLRGAAGPASLPRP